MLNALVGVCSEDGPFKGHLILGPRPRLGELSITGLDYGYTKLVILMTWLIH